MKVKRFAWDRNARDT